MVRNCYKVLSMVIGLALLGSIGQPVHASMYWMDVQSEATALKPTFVGASQEHITTVYILLEDTFVGPGETVKMPIYLCNPDPEETLLAGGMQFVLYFGNVHNAEFTGVQIDDSIDANNGDTDDTNNFQIKTNELEPEVLGVVIFSTDASYIPLSPGDVPVLVGWICFTADNVPPPDKALAHEPVGIHPLGTEYEVQVADVLISDNIGGLIGNQWQNGLVQVGIRGDLNHDGERDIRDVVLVILNILNRSNPASDGSVGDKIADANEDGDVNVADGIGIVNFILDLDVNHPNVKATPGSPIVVDLGTLTRQSDGQLVIPVMLDADGMIAGAQATFTFDTDLMSVGTPFMEGDAGNMLIDSRVTDGEMRVVAISLDKDRGLNTGMTPMLLIPVTLLGDQEATVTLTDLVLSNRFAQVLPVTLGTEEQSLTKDALAPAAFALRPASPNPFNPATTISYEVPQQAHITLTVYNVLGQEVIRLVDQVQAAGRYQVTWNAVNAQGYSVSSGIYLYQLNSSTGFNDTRRMTLLK